MVTDIAVREWEARFFEVMKRVCLGESFVITSEEGQAIANLRRRPGSGIDEESAKIFEED